MHSRPVYEMPLLKDERVRTAEIFSREIIYDIGARDCVTTLEWLYCVRCDKYTRWHVGWRNRVRSKFCFVK